MKSLGAGWWMGLGLGLCVGVFVTALLVETEAIPATSVGWKLIRSGSSLAGIFVVVVGGWLHRRTLQSSPQAGLPAPEAGNK